MSSKKLLQRTSVYKTDESEAALVYGDAQYACPLSGLQEAQFEKHHDSLQCAGQPLPTKNIPAANIKSAEAERP